MEKIKDFENLLHGLYKIKWKSGGSSLASVGSLYDGKRWYAPTNWTSETTKGIASVDWDKVKYVKQLILI